MKVLIIGKGGREHALAWKSRKSPLVSEVFVAPGNAGMTKDATLVNISETDPVALADFAEKEGIALTIIGPEASLVAGVADEFKKRNLLVWGPTKDAAQIEGSKDFSKQMMVKYNAPTAHSESFTDSVVAKNYVREIGLPIVIKADGLAAGKGVVIPETLEEACATIDDMLEGNKFGEAGSCILIEEMLEGEEFSLMCFVHNGTVIPMVMAQDHKRAYDNDEGPNTGGMGAYAPTFGADSEEVKTAVKTIMQPIVDGLTKEGMPYTGFLYGGLFLTKDGFKVIEFNARFGDPEAQIILPLLETDFVEIIHNLLTDQALSEIQWANKYAIGVVLASEGYPDAPQTGYPLNTPSFNDEDELVFYAGVKEQDGQLLSDGGRILLNVAIADDFKSAYDKAYANMKELAVPHTFFRTDIGHKQFNR
ncbi:phosphoribosylamine--glycine ligase [Ignatzschineria sp. LJL83]